MTDCPLCHRPVDGLFCRYCRPRNPPIPPAAKAKIDAILKRKQPDREAELERTAIQDEAA